MKKLIALSIFGIAFGLLEAIVVYYLHQIIGYFGTQQLPLNNYSVLLNLKVIAFIVTKQPLLKNSSVTSIEMLREFSTIVMLICLAYIAGRTIKQRIGAFLIAFSFWD